MTEATFIRDVRETRGLYGKQTLHRAKLYRLSEPVVGPYDIPTRYVILARSIPQVEPTAITVYPADDSGRVLFYELDRFETDSFETAIARVEAGQLPLPLGGAP